MPSLKQGSVLTETPGNIFLHNKRTTNKVSARHLTHLLAAFLLIGLAYRVYQGAPFSDFARTHHVSTRVSIDQSALKPLSSPDLESFQQCSIKNLFDTDLYFLKDVGPVSFSEYQSRRDRLANALVEDGADAFLIEPGYTFKYYANVSQAEWEVWEPEERPFVMVVRPTIEPGSGKVVSNTTFLCPSFEAERARLLSMPFAEPIQIIPWEEHWSPYATLRSSGIFEDLDHTPRLMVDEEMRDFIQRGFLQEGFDVIGLGGRVEAVRQTKSQEEVDILRAVNTGTVEAVRQMRKCLYPGLTENQIMEVLDNTIRAAEMEPFFDIVLFDENASNPHGGTNGTNVLESETFVLIDVGAHLHGYSSDICRTFFPPFLKKPTVLHDLSPQLEKKLKVWDIVFEAQTASIHQMRASASAASVDLAARGVITDAGYGEAFTHRVGHGIVIKAHESPYLNKGNTRTLLERGMAFTSEPGIYLVDEFGVRHEDILLVQKNSDPILLTGERAQGPWDP
ncbi:xaa-pro dipeptidase, putative [Paecilomyces variotii No. 5]|uniref:Xaa-pro dipeptidase, putative n=1 Tax=Byssochlamys spectabilis (strain No. 5 / NBRC 109023) TaxID=1356009 RepID=V5FZP2_BYSSN|nr:xaa-pro dipeptidase, putative [Paecilomyces variotii No. 5]